jgi:REP element-mobilizing transposase RayT
MPNHVHLVFKIGDEYVSRIADSTARNGVSGYRVTKILQDLKKYTAGESNKILSRSGQFWHNESYDHVIRNEEEHCNIVNYIVQNPVKAGLVDNYKKWKWTYIEDSVKDLIVN